MYLHVNWQAGKLATNQIVRKEKESEREHVLWESRRKTPDELPVDIETI